MKTEKFEEERDYSFLENYAKLDVQKDWEQVQKRMKATGIRKLAGYWRVAALIIVLLGVGILTRHLVRGPVELLHVTAAADVMEINLPDGSLVVLNRGAELDYPEKFRGSERLVIMSGEAWFEVERDRKHPFIVNISDRASIEVLGTKFNVKEDAEREQIGVQVMEGSVAFSGREWEGTKLVLQQGDQGMLDKTGLKVKVKADPNFLSWKTGILTFDQTPLKEVVRQLASHYHVNIECDPGLPDDLTFTSSFKRQELDQVLEEICLVLGLEYEQSEEGVRIY